MEELELEREIFAEVIAWRTAERQTSAVSGPFCFQTCIYDTYLNFFFVKNVILGNADKWTAEVGSFL